MKTKLLLTAALIFTANMILFSQQSKIQNSKTKIKSAWIRPAVKYANSALYFIIESTTTKADTLLGAESKAAEEVEVHESFKKDNDRMGMRPAGKLAIGPKSKFEFKPGGFHVMFLSVTKDLKIGDSLEVILRFKYAGKIKVKAEVRDTPMMKN